MNSISKFFKVDFLQGPIIRSLIIFAIPLFISSIFQQMYNMVDTMIVGNYLGDQALAAMGACASISDLMVGFCLGVGNGMAVVAARSFGAGNEKLLKKSVAMTICLGAMVTIVISICGSLILRPLLELLNTPAEIIDQSYRYISTIVACTLVMLAYNLSAGMLRAIGNSLMPLIFLIISSLINVVLDIVFISEFHMGVQGAAVATVISQGISAVLCILYIWKKAPMLVPKREHFAYDKGLCQELLGQGISMGLMGSIVSCGTVILQSGINGFGTLIIAGHTAARKLHSVCMMFIATMSMACSTFVSQNKGAGNRDRILRAMNYMYVYDVVAASIITVLLHFLARPMVHLLTGSTETVVLDNASMYLYVAGPFYAVLGVLLQTRSALQGIGEKLLPIISSVIEMVGKVLFTIVFIPKFQYTAVIFCEPIIWCAMAAQLLFCYYRNPFVRGVGLKKSEEK
ncbi:MAG: MATE family efflux transporter [Lachnospiraceae bacterium]|nr:MATE family efflux transporter [Lachnospiraceae bacterium]